MPVSDDDKRHAAHHAKHHPSHQKDHWAELRERFNAKMDYERERRQKYGGF